MIGPRFLCPSLGFLPIDSCFVPSPAFLTEVLGRGLGAGSIALSLEPTLDLLNEIFLGRWSAS